MKHKLYTFSLAAVSAVCIALALAQASFSGAFTSAMAFPFEQIGFGLRALSLSGGPGNAVAIAIYAAASLSPIAALAVLRKRRRLFPEDVLLALLSAALFAVIYLMINPAIIGAAAGRAVGKAILGGAVYSVLCGYFVLRLLRLFLQSDAERLEWYMSIMLKMLGVLFVVTAFGTRLNDLLNSLKVLNDGNTAAGRHLFASYFVLDMGYTADMIPYILNVVIVSHALRLLDALRTDRYSVETVELAERMSRFCAIALSTTVFLSIAFNLAQLLLITSARTINVTVNIPIFSIAFVLAALLFTRFIAENRRLKDENDAFI